MSCYCDYDYEPDEFCHEIRPIARRAHICCECGAEIKPGDRYERVVGKWGMQIERFKTCSLCLALRDHLIATRQCFCWSYGSLREDARRALSDGEFRPGERFALLALMVQSERERRMT